MEYTSFRNYVEAYHEPPFYDDLGKLQVEYEFIKELLKRNKNQLDFKNNNAKT